MKKVYIRTYYGFGDNFWSYPFIRELAKQCERVYIETHFPFLYWDLKNVKFIEPRRTKLITCNNSLNKYKPEFWLRRPYDAIKLTFPYYLSEFKRGTTLQEGFCKTVPIKGKIDYSYPVHRDWIAEAYKLIKDTPKPILLIKNPCDRLDWKNSARLPRSRYYQYLIDKYGKEYYIISVGNEQMERNPIQLLNIDKRFEHGEIELTTLIGLAYLADIIITHNALLFPIGLSVNTKTLVINGGYSDPNMYADKNRIDMKHIKIITPNPCCQCINRDHHCNKEISLEELDKAFEDLT